MFMEMWWVLRIGSGYINRRKIPSIGCHESRQNMKYFNCIWPIGSITKTLDLVCDVQKWWVWKLIDSALKDVNDK